MVSYFEKFLNEVDDLDHPSSSFMREEKMREDGFVKKMKALESIAKEDFEAAKIQTEFFAADLENLRDQILK